MTPDDHQSLHNHNGSQDKFGNANKINNGWNVWNGRKASQVFLIAAHVMHVTAMFAIMMITYTNRYTNTAQRASAWGDGL